MEAGWKGTEKNCVLTEFGGHIRHLSPYGGNHSQRLILRVAAIVGWLKGSETTDWGHEGILEYWSSWQHQWTMTRRDEGDSNEGEGMYSRTQVGWTPVQVRSGKQTRVVEPCSMCPCWHWKSTLLPTCSQTDRVSALMSVPNVNRLPASTLKSLEETLHTNSHEVTHTDTVVRDHYSFSRSPMCLIIPCWWING